ncbi:MAG: vitamin K epoxide reductase family protein [Arthrospira sp. SH-MAG29]|nr:vitamin K epoxide reductase family protein [Arthrospira sp. SH-MAG29]MBS0015230.1 vitamin K epoxide reductase family protein [Arthrospira sp. SH-MAG29]
MVRSPSTPWIYRHSRLIILTIAILGAIETAYLTGVKLLGGVAVCPTQGCHEVLNSPLATLWGVPISLFGFLAYFTMASLATTPWLVNPSSQKNLRTKLEAATWWIMFSLATAMAVMSGFLMYLLSFELQAFCPYCVASAIFSISLFVLTMVGRFWDDFGQQLLVGVAVTMVALVTLLGVYDAQPTSATQPPTLVSRQITTNSGAAEISLATHLQQIGAKTFGAYWCPHCYEQKQLFGRQAFAILDYVECDPQGPNARSQLCQQAGINAYPTWEINQKFYQGRLSLQKLAELSGYEDRQDFANSPFD